MKKTLLLGSLAALFAAPVGVAAVDTAQYEDMDGLTCTNVWAHGKFFDKDEFLGFEFTGTNKARTATIVGDKVVVGFSRTMEDGEATSDFAHICKFDLATGKFLGLVQVTCDGEPVKGLLCANQVGTDYYGNVWMAGLNSDASKTPITI